MLTLDDLTRDLVETTRLQNLYDEKCEEVRELLELNGKLRLLLSENNIDHEL